MPLYSSIRSLIFFSLFITLMAACSQRKEAEVKRAVDVLSEVKDLCDKDSFPRNDSILNFPVKVFIRENMDSCLAVAYFCQGEINQKNFYLLRAIDSYVQAGEFVGSDSLLNFKINLELAKIYRFKMRHDMEKEYINSAEQLLHSLHDSLANVEFLKQKALYYQSMKDMPKVYSTLRTALGYIKENDYKSMSDIYRLLSHSYMLSGMSDSVVYFADKGLQTCSNPKLKSELYILKGLSYSSEGMPDSVMHYILPNIYSVDMLSRVKAYRVVSEMYDGLGMVQQSHLYLKKHTLSLDSLILDRRDELLEKMQGIHEYKLQKERANKAEMQAASDKLLFTNFVLAALILIMVLSVLLHYNRYNKRKLAEKLREETCLKMEETLKRRDMEISLANKQEELRQKEIEKLNKNIDYYKQLNNVTLPIIMRRQNAQGALHLSDDDWKIIVGNADACFDMFSQRLKDLCPQLTDDEIRFCCLVKMELPMSVLSEIYHIAKASISRRKMRLKEKIGIESVSFDEFIIGF